MLLQLEDEAKTLHKQVINLSDVAEAARARHQVAASISESAALLAAHHSGKMASIQTQKVLHIMHAHADGAKLLLTRAASRRHDALELSKKIKTEYNTDPKGGHPGLQERGLAKAHAKRLQVRVMPTVRHSRCS
jgi:hypothetical protein